MRSKIFMYVCRAFAYVRALFLIRARARVEAVYNPNKQVKPKYLKGLDVWFILPGEPLANTLTKYCDEKQMHW